VRRGEETTVLDRIKDKLGIHDTVEDVEGDPNLANSRRTGGEEKDEIDSASTTGTGSSGEFVGQVAGQDPGFDEETGAEKRAEAGEDG
jgi:hypothetical protein